jgi:hypothetical protein
MRRAAVAAPAAVALAAVALAVAWDRLISSILDTTLDAKRNYSSPSSVVPGVSIRGW